MKANELRIGNYVYDSDGDFTDVMELRDEFVWCKRNNVKALYENIKPIPLTPEILNAAGFDMHARSVSFADSGYDPTYFYYILDGVDEFSQRIYRHGFVLGSFRDGFYYQANQRRNKGIKIEHLHQLQNLYFALTGTELEIDIEKLK